MADSDTAGMGAMGDPLISVVIPNWNGKRFLAACLTSLRRQTWRHLEIVLIDNGSTDGSVDFVRQLYPEVRILCFAANRGFSVAVNAGIAAARGAFIALLNNDARAEPRWLEALYAGIIADSSVGFAASKMLSVDRSGKLDGAGDGYTRYGLAFARGRNQVDRGQYDRADEPFSACAGAALYRRELFEQVGAFDEDFFAYLEDVDLCFRSRWLGYRGCYAPDAVVYHVGAGSRGHFTPFHIRHDVKNMLHVMTKNFPASLLLREWPRILLCQLKVAAHYCVLRHAPLAYGRGLLGYLRQLPRMLAKRRSIMQSRRAPFSAIRPLLLASERERRRTHIL